MQLLMKNNSSKIEITNVEIDETVSNGFPGNTHCVDTLNKDLHLEEGDDDLYAAIDKIMNKIKLSFVKMKGKRNVPMHVSKKF